MIEKIRELYWAKPFIPFTLHLADGRSIPVSHPEFMAQEPSGRMLVVYQTDDTSHYVNVSLVTSVSVSEGAGAMS